MRPKATPQTAKTVKLDPEAGPQKTNEGPLIEVEIPEAPDTLDRPSLEHRKEEASRPLYLARYE